MIRGERFAKVRQMRILGKCFSSLSSASRPSGTPALGRPAKITFAEMRDMGVRGILVYCADYTCSHSQAISAERWADDVRFSDTRRALPVRPAGSAPLMWTSRADHAMAGSGTESQIERAGMMPGHSNIS